MAHIIRVVVIEPDNNLRLILTTNLSIDGRFEVVGESAGGDEMLRLALARSPDAIVLDYLSVNPMDALPAIKQSLPEVTLICCSERNGHLQEQALQLGADTFLMKDRTLSDDIISALIAANPDSEWA